MRTVQRIAKNSGIFFIAQIIGSVLSFFFFAYSARYLGAKNFGILSFALALGAIFGIFIDFGLGQVVVREIARDKSLIKKYLGNIIGIKMVLAVVFFTAMVVFASFHGYSKDARDVLYLIGLAVICGTFNVMFTAVFQAHEKMEYDAFGEILNNVLLFLGVFLAISQKFNVVGFACIYLFANTASLIYNIIVCSWKFATPKIEIDLAFWKPIIKTAIPFALAGVFTTILNWVDTVMLSMMKGDTVTGWYNAAYRIVFVLLFIPSALNVAIFPVMSRFFVSSKDALKFAYEKSFKYLTILAVPMAVGGTLLAERIIFFVFGTSYRPSILAFQILIWSVAFIFIGTPASNLLGSTNRQAVITKVVGFSVVLNIVLNLLFISKYSYVAAAINTVVSMFVILLGVMAGAVKSGHKMPIMGIIVLILRALFSSLIMSIFVLYFKNINLFLLIGASVIIYFVSMLIVGSFDKEDFGLVKKIINK